MKKTSPLFALCAFFLVLVGVLVASPALAVFNENFEGLELGDITTNDGWRENSGRVGTVDNTQANTGAQSLMFDYSADTGYINQGVIRDLDEAHTSGEINFSFRMSEITSNVNRAGSIQFHYFDLYLREQFRLPFRTLPTTNQMRIFISSDFEDGAYVDINKETWTAIKIEWNTSQRRVSVGGTSGDWIDRGATNGGITNIVFDFGFGTTGWKIWFDDFSSAPPVIEGYAPILTPTSPERNAENVVNFDEGFDVSGAVAIPTANIHIYDKLIVSFRKPDSFFPAKTLTINLPALTAGQSYNYSATTTIPITSSGNNFFKVGYTLTGTYAGSFAENPPISQEALAFDKTWVKDSPYGAPAYLITPSIKPALPAMEDCSQYSGINKIICDFRNFIAGAFLPTDDALSQIGGTMDALKSKFPMNYARAIGDSFSTITAGIDDDAGFSFSLLGNTGQVDTSLFKQDIGGGATLGGTIKLLLTFFVFIIFLWWALGYMHRILK